MKTEEYLISKAWKKTQDPKGRPCYVKGNEDQLPSFKLLGKKKNEKLDSFLSGFNSFFDGKNYANLPSSSIINPKKDTLFIGAGLQTIINMHSSGKDVNGMRYITQPCLRVNAIEKVGVKDGYSTSFVNICTEQLNASGEEHLQHLENWFNFLSKNGLYIGHLRLVEDHSWEGGKDLEGNSLLIYYSDLQIGDAVFVRSKTGGLTISDIGFGLERLCWAVNKTDSYYESIGPYYELKKNGILSLDLLRSLSLMTLNGVEPSNHNEGYRFKQFIKRYAENSSEINPSYLINFYSDFWKKFTPTALSKDVDGIVRGELHKQKIADICKILGVSSHCSNFSDFIEESRKLRPTSLPTIERYINSTLDVTL